MTAVSVLPTPLGPTIRKTPIGRLGSVRLALAVRIRWPIASRACAWPMTRSSSLDRRLRTVWISLATIRPTGMPVQPATTSAIVWLSTLTCISGDSPWRARSSSNLDWSADWAVVNSAEGANAWPFPSARCFAFSVAKSASTWAASLRISSTRFFSSSQRASSPSSRFVASAKLCFRSSISASSAAPVASWRSRILISMFRWSISRRQSSTAGGVAFWPIATRAQAVSSRLTALSGSCRAGM